MAIDKRRISSGIELSQASGWEADLVWVQILLVTLNVGNLIEDLASSKPLNATDVDRRDTW